MTYFFLTIASIW